MGMGQVPFALQQFAGALQDFATGCKNPAQKIALLPKRHHS
jgi:hypothetical protein